jgi:cell pole-organizing protein PopZ
MEEILASIRRIISDDDPAGDSTAGIAVSQAGAVGSQLPPMQVAPRSAAVPSSRPEPPEPALPEAEEIDSMLAQLQATAVRRASALAEPADSDIHASTEQIAEPEEKYDPRQEQEQEHAQDHEQEREAPPAFRAATREPDAVFEEKPPASLRAVAEIRRTATEPHRGLISPATSAAVDSAFNSLAETVLVQNGRTLEDLVREMLRPMLKAWLDENLPGMVERLVRAEIERVSRGRG